MKSELLWSWLKLRASLQFARFVISNGRLRKFNFGLIKWPPLEVNRLNMILYTYKKKEIRLYMPDRLNIIENVGNSLNWMVMSPKRICGPGVRVYTFQIFFLKLLLIRWWIQRILTPTFSFLLSSSSETFFLNFALLPNLTLPLTCWQMAQMTQMCAGDCKCARVCMGLHGSAQVCGCVQVFAAVCCNISEL